MDLFSEIAFSTSKLVTRKYSTSFSKAVALLEPEKQDAIYSIYGFVRFADEVVDTFHQNNKKKLIDNFENALNEALTEGISLNPVLQSFSITIKKYNIDMAYIDAFLASMRADLNKQNYNTQTELNQYIYGSADVVGLMCLQVFTDGDKAMFETLKQPAIKLGSAFQKVNFLRDLKADTEGLHRIYLPQLSSGEFTENAKNEIIANISADFSEAREGISQLPGKSKLAVYLAYSYYKKLLNRLERTPAGKITESRIRVPDSIKLMLLIFAKIRYKLGLI
ncbi:MAG: phytoene/squalene synthase family protein [Draconibacterium sp.]